jgi:hypothetical protein
LLEDTNPGFRDKYACARELQADVWAEEIIEISDDNSRDVIVGEDGKPRENYDNVQRSRLRVVTRKWAAAKAAPKKYGDRIEAAHTGHVTVQITGDDARLL